jgi:inner membrane protein
MFEAVLASFAHPTLWHWFALAAALLAIEVIAPSTFLLWPGLAAVVMGFIVLFAPELSWPVQVVVFSALAILATVAGRMWWIAGRDDAPGAAHLNRRADQYVGRRASVAESFVNGRGTILIDDTRWQAKSDDGSNPFKGASVEVTAAESTVLTVRAQG